MTQPNPFPSKRKKIVGYILLFVGIFIGLAEIAWSYYSIFAHISRDLLAWLVEGLVAVVSIVLMLIGYRLIGGKWRVRDERYGMDLRRRMRLGSLLFLVGYPVFVIFFLGATSVYNAYLAVIYWLVAFPAGIAMLVISL